MKKIIKSILWSAILLTSTIAKGQSSGTLQQTEKSRTKTLQSLSVSSTPPANTPVVSSSPVNVTLRPTVIQGSTNPADASEVASSDKVKVLSEEFLNARKLEKREDPTEGVSAKVQK